MSGDVGFVGDIHGEVGLLESMIDLVTPLGLSTLVFLGDYVDRGRQSRDVLELLISLKRSQAIDARFIEGNHDRAMREALQTGRLDAFLRIGGAATIRSYVNQVEANVAAQFVQEVPPSHVSFLQELEPFVLGHDFLAAHAQGGANSVEHLNGRYGVYGHTPQPRSTPYVGEKMALVDTGCGTTQEGRLTCLLWPSRKWIQVRPE